MPNSHFSGQRMGKRKQRPRGSTMLEAAIVISLLFIPMILGISSYGLNFIRMVQANQINRDAGHMFGRRVDFSTGSGTFNRQIITQMAPALAQTTGGTATMILSHVIYVAPTTCTSCAFTCNNCANLNHAAIKTQYTFGTPSLYSSVYGTVPAAAMNPSTQEVTDPYGNTAVRADGILSVLTFGVNPTDAQEAYVAETFYSAADLAIPGFPAPRGTFARAYF